MRRFGRFDNMKKWSISSNDTSSTFANFRRDILGMKDQVFVSYHKKGKVNHLPILLVPIIPKVSQGIIGVIVSRDFDGDGFHGTRTLDQMWTDLGMGPCCFVAIVAHARVHV